jgi:hypothetical protein
MFITFFSENLAVYEKNLKKLYSQIGRRCRTALQLHTEGYKHTLIICNTYYFSTASTVPRTRLDVTLQIHFLSLESVLLFNN